MLAKQAWRVITNPQCLLYQMLQQKYFPSTSFLIAEICHAPSFTRRSLYHTTDLFVAGLRWQIGNGESVAIVGVPWLPRPDSFQLICQPKTLHGSTKVTALLNEDGWNEGLIREEFSQIDSECILSILAPRDNRHDDIIWHYGKHGRFSVSCAYTLACKMKQKASSSYKPRKWDFVWGLCLAPKIKLFV
ncbi:UNVERIFIED_CONTAM: hypothetical protein Slati_1485100 [Sesamum latifolium]|uniref:Uncharacterized protein n=1 Tax=Sesamum latifolium TaxID=2727402 RepID=A0AAW2X5J2_9LAMI